MREDEEVVIGTPHAHDDDKVTTTRRGEGMKAKRREE